MQMKDSVILVTRKVFFKTIIDNTEVKTTRGLNYA